MIVRPEEPILRRRRDPSRHVMAKAAQCPEMPPSRERPRQK
jgi:hypothetical protein